MNAARRSHTILYYCVATHLGGAERSMLDLIIRVSAQSVGYYRPVVVVPRSDGPLCDALREHGIEVRVLPMPAGLFGLSRARPIRSALRGVLSWPGMRFYRKRLRQLVQTEAPSLIHTTGIKCHLLGAPLASQAPVLWHLRDILLPGTTRTVMLRVRERYPVHVLANSYATAFAFDGRMECPTVVYNGIDLEHFTPGEGGCFRDLFPDAPTAPIVGVVGVLQRGKGIRGFLQMAAKLRDAGSSARFVVVGDAIYDTRRDAGYRAELQAEAVALGLDRHVAFAGYQADNRQVMRSLDVLVSAAEHPESFGRVLIEAQACGTPVAASALGGSLEIIEDRVHGRLFRPGDPEAMATAVRSLLEDGELRSRCIEAGLESVRDRFGVQSYVAGVVRTYDRLLNGVDVDPSVVAPSVGSR